MDVVVVSVHPVGKGLSLVVTASLRHWHDADPVALTQHSLRGEAHVVGLYQLTRSITYSWVTTSHRKNLQWESLLNVLWNLLEFTECTVEFTRVY